MALNLAKAILECVISLCLISLNMQYSSKAVKPAETR